MGGHQKMAGQVQSVMDCVMEHVAFDGCLNEEHNSCVMDR